MIYVQCPHCQGIVEIEQLNCKIFRHGIMKSSGQQINPHAAKTECDFLSLNNMIYGCGKPFQVILEGVNYIAIVCEYI